MNTGWLALRHEKPQFSAGCVWQVMARDILASRPYAGHSRPDLTTLAVTFWTMPRFVRYLIVYDPVSDPLRILRILHAARNLSVELG